MSMYVYARVQGHACRVVVGGHWSVSGHSLVSSAADRSITLFPLAPPVTDAQPSRRQGIALASN